jgi:peptidoglycan hydrolase CwlO-like protein
VVTTAILIIAMSTTVIADPLSDRLREQQNQLNESNSQYKSAKDKVEAIEKQIEHFDMQIEIIMGEIQDNKTQIKSMQNDIELSEKDITKAEEDIKEEQELYNERMRAMYMNGSVGYLDVILGAEDLSDLFEKVEAVKKITELDKEIVKELKGKQEELRLKQEKLKEEQDKLLALNKSQEEKVKKLEEDKKSQDSLIAEARANAAVYEDALKEDKAKIKETKRLIEQMKKDLAAKNKPSRGTGSISSDEVVVYASKFLGTPYAWGANGAEYFDCSGFTKYVYAHFGVRLPRVSRDQAKTGTYVSRGDLQAGDLVFFGSPTHHVGIYVGNDSYIHAPRTGDVVKISSLSGRSDFTHGRRVK